MACPYAKYIKGTIAYCTLLNKKVSTLRYPCKGNYRRCPIYVRRARRQREAPRQEQAQPQVEARQAQQPATPPSPQAEAPRAEPVQPASQPSTPASSQVQPGAVRVPSAVEPSEALCDSLVLASLIAASNAVATYRGPLRNLIIEASKYLGGEGFLFIVGRLQGGLNVRMLYAGRIATFAFERQLQPVCGEEAVHLLSQLAGEQVDAVIYRVDWNSIPLWKDRIAKELGVS